jgi:hypothetical protein
MDLKPEYKLWAKRLHASIPGGTFEVTRHADESESTFLDVFSSRTSPGVVVATIGVMEVNLSSHACSPLFSEIIMDSRDYNMHVANLAATLGFYVVKDGWCPSPGTVFENMIEMYLPELTVKHIMFVPPFQWKSGMSEVDLGSKTIYPVLGVPISDREYQFVEEHGSESLEDLWEEANCDVLDWFREGIV